jgi:plastocyanin domain-containing protein
MLFLGVRMLGIFPWLSRLSLHVPWSRSRKLSSAASRRGPFFIGLLNGLMPCGPLQTMQVYALGTGGFLAGAFSMFVFSLGTVPLMFGFGAISTLLSARFNRGMLKASGVLVAVLGVVMFTHGLNLFGVSLGLPPAKGSSIAVAKISDGVQTVRTPIESGRYFPFVVQAGVPVRWVIQARADDLNGCNEIVTVPEYGIRKQLVPGENVIEFTPKRVGTVGYTCWMGMISSSIRVVSDLAALSADDLKTPPPNQVQPGAVQPGGDIAGAFPGGQGGGGGCCAGSSNPRFAGGRVPTENIGLARISGDEQVVDIRVDDQGYTPAVVVLQRNVKAKIRFIPAKLSSCNAVVAFPAYQGQLNLAQGSTETPWLETVEDYTFQCGMGMLHGYVKVVDDLSRVDLVAVRQQVSAFKASSSGGGCCGQ